MCTAWFFSIFVLWYLRNTNLNTGEQTINEQSKHATNGDDTSQQSAFRKRTHPLWWVRQFPGPYAGSSSQKTRRKTSERSICNLLSASLEDYKSWRSAVHRHGKRPAQNDLSHSKRREHYQSGRTGQVNSLQESRPCRKLPWVEKRELEHKNDVVASKVF